MKKTFTVVAMLIHLMTCPSSRAETDEFFGYLRDEPASLLDVGMVRLDGLLSKFRLENAIRFGDGPTVSPSNIGISSMYEASRQQIIVTIMINEGTVSVEQLASGCKYALRQLGIAISKSISKLFDSTKAQEAQFQQIPDDAFELRCYVFDGDTTFDRYWAWQHLDSRTFRSGKWRASRP